MQLGLQKALRSPICQPLSKSNSDGLSLSRWHSSCFKKKKREAGWHCNRPPREMLVRIQPQEPWMQIHSSKSLSYDIQGEGRLTSGEFGLETHHLSWSCPPLMQVGFLAPAQAVLQHWTVWSQAELYRRCGRGGAAPGENQASRNSGHRVQRYLIGVGGLGRVRMPLRLAGLGRSGRRAGVPVSLLFCSLRRLLPP